MIIKDLASQNDEIRQDVLNYDDIRQIIPKLDGHE